MFKKSCFWGSAFVIIAVVFSGRGLDAQVRDHSHVRVMSQLPAKDLLATKVKSDRQENKDQEIGDEKGYSSEFHEPYLLKADGKIINIAEHSRHGHASPCLFDTDGDGVLDLVVGDFPGNFWVFRNTGSNSKSKFKFVGKLRAGSKAAKTPVY